MAASAETISPGKSDPSEDWTIVLPRRGKKNRAFNKCVIPRREKEVQLWAPIDLEVDPERESKLMQKMQICIQNFENSEFHRNLLNQIQNPDMLDKFLKVLGSEKKMQMVIYGIGSIESFESPRLQLSLAILLKRSFDWIGEVELFDPIISLTEYKVLTSLGCSILSINEQARRQAVKPTMFFMPHCEAELYNNLLEANWEVDQLNRLIIFGNSFGEYEQHASLCKVSAVAKSRKHVLAIRSFTEELRVNTYSDDFFRAFNKTTSAPHHLCDPPPPHCHHTPPPPHCHHLTVPPHLHLDPPPRDCRHHLGATTSPRPTTTCATTSGEEQCLLLQGKYESRIEQQRRMMEQHQQRMLLRIRRHITNLDDDEADGSEPPPL